MAEVEGTENMSSQSKRSRAAWQFVTRGSVMALAIASAVHAGPPDGSPENPFRGVQNPSFDEDAIGVPRWIVESERDTGRCASPIEIMHELSGPHKAFVRLWPHYLDVLTGDCARRSSCPTTVFARHSTLRQGRVEIPNCPNAELSFDLRVGLLQERQCLTCADYPILEVTVQEVDGDLTEMGPESRHTFFLNYSDIDGVRFRDGVWARATLPFQRARCDSQFEISFQLQMVGVSMNPMNNRAIFPATVDIDHVRLTAFAGAFDAPCFEAPATVPCGTMFSPGDDTVANALDEFAGPQDAPSVEACDNNSHRLACCPGDFNNDGFVNGADLGMLLGAWGPIDGSIPLSATIDMNCDGAVNGSDLGLLLGAWGSCPQ